MKISLKWLKELIEIKLSNDDLVSKLTDLGLECSGSQIGPSFSGVVVDKIEFLSSPGNLHNHWAIFFIITTLMVIPSLVFLWIIKDKLNLYEK